MEQLLSTLARDWLAWLTNTKGRSRGTVQLYKPILAQFVDLVGDRPLERVTADEIERWLQRPRGGRAQGNVAAPATQHRDASCIRGFCDWLLARGEISRNPAALVCTPTIRNRQPRPISDAVWTKLWEHADGADAIALGLGFFCGLRREELTRLRCSHVDLGGRRLVNFVRKGGGEDTLPVGTMLDVFDKRLPHLGAERLWPLVTAHALERDGKDWLLGWHDLGRPQKRSRTDLGVGQLDPQHLNAWLDRLTTRAECSHVSPHQLRHSCATNLLRAGVPLAIVSTLLNHANVHTTMRYCKTGGDELGEWLARLGT